MAENHGLDVDGDGDIDRNSMRDVEVAGYTVDNARDSLYIRQTLAIPRKPVQKSISSHFRENISPTSPTGVTFPDIEVVSPESLRRTATEDRTSQQFHDLDIISPETILERIQSPELSREVSDVADEPRVPERPMSFVSAVEELQYQEPNTLFEEPRQAPTPPLGDEYHPYQSTGSQDHLLKLPPPKRQDSGNWFAKRRKHWWLMELLSFLLSLLASVAIIIILHAYDNQPLSKLPHSIMLNSLLALFTTVAEVGLILPISEALSQSKWIWFKEDGRPLSEFEIFDQASRGPIGGIKLLSTLKFG